MPAHLVSREVFGVQGAGWIGVPRGQFDRLLGSRRQVAQEEQFVEQRFHLVIVGDAACAPDLQGAPRTVQQYDGLAVLADPAEECERSRGRIGRRCRRREARCAETAL